MALDNIGLVIDHHLNRLDTAEHPYDVAHVLCICGQLDFSFSKQSFTLKEGEAMIIRASELLERRQASKDLEVMCVYATPEFLERCTPRSNYGIRGSLALYSCPIMPMSHEQFVSLRNDFLMIEKCLMNERHLFQEETLICAVQMMILDFFDIHASHNGLANISFQDTDIIERFMQMLERGDYVTNREVGYYADKLFVTPKYLSEVCKSVSGRTANYWISRFTTIHIRRLLQEKELSFTQISDMFGFSSSAYFSRFVQKHLGASPTSFRE